MNEPRAFVPHIGSTPEEFAAAERWLRHKGEEGPVNPPRILSVTPLYGVTDADLDALAFGPDAYETLEYEVEVGCTYKVVLPMGPRWERCFDCGETWRATR